MQQKSIHINYQEGSDVKQLPKDIQQLISETIQFADNAYAPYSNFHVSAGLLLENGKILKGANVENASYPVSICAERTLLSHTVSNYPKEKINTLVIYVDRAGTSPVPPCGICRQTLLEVELNQQSPIKVIMVAKAGNFIQFEKAADLLPLYFDGEFL
ncbi:MAG: cytidine deaminase [Crocinitomicaceae bacterium]